MNLEAAWYNKSGWLILLWPLSLLFRAIAWLRRLYWQKLRGTGTTSRTGTDSISGPDGEAIQRGYVPLIVVGNITVGGTGKTPFVIALGRLLQGRGYKPGVISRGYAAKAPHNPYTVTAESHPYLCGDEALLIARNLGCPVVVDPNRREARDAILAQGVDVIISDDGLQHYALARDLEIAIIDGERGLGNGMCLPAGPLREPPGRLQEVDWLVINGATCQPWAALAPSANGVPACSTMNLHARCWINLRSGEEVQPAEFARLAATQPVHALAGIGNPGRFFALVGSLGIEAVYHPFPDHYNFESSDLRMADDGLLLMTEKDAVKCQAIAGPNCWYLAIEAELDETLTTDLLNRLEGLVRLGKL